MRPLALLALLTLSGCALCPSMDENCSFMHWMNGETEGNGRMTPEEACNAQHGNVVLKAGEFDRCDP